MSLRLQKGLRDSALKIIGDRCFYLTCMQFVCGGLGPFWRCLVSDVELSYLHMSSSKNLLGDLILVSWFWDTQGNWICCCFL